MNERRNRRPWRTACALLGMVSLCGSQIACQNPSARRAQEDAQMQAQLEQMRQQMGGLEVQRVGDAEPIRIQEAQTHADLRAAEATPPAPQLEQPVELQRLSPDPADTAAPTEPKRSFWSFLGLGGDKARQPSAGAPQPQPAPAQPMRIERLPQPTEVEIADVALDSNATAGRSDGMMPLTPQPAAPATPQLVEAAPLAPAPVASSAVVEHVDVQTQARAQAHARQQQELMRRQQAASRDALAFVQRMEAAHGGSVWNREEGISAHIAVDFGDKRVIDGRFIFDTALSRVRADLRDGTVLVFDGQDAWVYPADSKLDKPRFHVLTWPYFLAAPFKLDDRGAIQEALPPQILNGQPHPAVKITFGAGVGDAPDDWYIAYVDPGTNWLRAMAYIVTYGKGPEAVAQAQPHAILYDNFVLLDGVVIPRHWSFWNWSPTLGIHSQPRGFGRVSNLQFVGLSPKLFVPPPGSLKIPAPSVPASHASVPQPVMQAAPAAPQPVVQPRPQPMVSQPLLPPVVQPAPQYQPQPQPVVQQVTAPAPRRTTSPATLERLEPLDGPVVVPGGTPAAQPVPQAVQDNPWITLPATTEK